MELFQSFAAGSIPAGRKFLTFFALQHQFGQMFSPVLIGLFLHLSHSRNLRQFWRLLKPLFHIPNLQSLFSAFISTFLLQLCDLIILNTSA